MKTKILTGTLFLSMMAGGAMAQTVSQEEAAAKALSFLQQGPRRAQGASTPGQLQLAYKAGKGSETYYYIFNDQQSGAFVIVAGDERATEILGYGDNGCIDFEQAPANFRWWMSQYEAQIHAAIQQDFHPGTAHPAAAPQRAARTDVAELVRTKWDQSTPYNNMLPYTGTGNYALATGCVATAMAQVMYVHQYPATTGYGSNSFTGIGNLTFSADFANTTYDWSNMLLEYKPGQYTQAQADAVATLMYHCGVAVNMNYGQLVSGGSGAVSSAIPRGLTTYFGYDKSAQYVQRDYYTDDEWTDLIYSELAAGRPVLYGGQDVYGGGGHQFVCHGYSAADNTFAINWGWSGMYDGYFTLIGVDGLQPGGSGAGGAGDGASYTGGQDIVINVMPDHGTPKTPLVMYCITQDGRTVQLTTTGGTPVASPAAFDLTQARQTLLLSFWPGNVSGDQRTFETSAMFRDVMSGATFYAQYRNAPKTLDANYLLQQTVTFSSDEFEVNGTYEVLPVVREQGETEWQLLRFPTSVATPMVTVTGGQPAGQRYITFNISGTTVEEHSTLAITHDKLYNGDITYTATPSGIVSIDGNGVVTGLTAGTVTITATGEETAYFFQTSKDFVVEVTPYVKKDITFAISADNVMIGQTLTITDDAEHYTGTIAYTSSDTSIATVDATGKVRGVAAGRVTVTATAPADEFYNLSTKSFDIAVTAPGIALTGLNVPNSGYITMNRWDFTATVVNNTSTNWSKYFLKCKVPFDDEQIITVYSSEIKPFYSGDLGTAVFDIHEQYGDYFGWFWSTGSKVTTSVLDYDLNVLSDPITFTFCDELTVSYTLTAAGWGTICLPFEAEVPAGLTAYRVTGLSGSSLVKEEVGFLRMNTPYLLTGTAGTYRFVGPDTPVGTAWQGGILVGNTAASTESDPVYAPAGSYVLQLIDGVLGFYRVEADGTQRIRQHSAYLQPAGGNSSLYYSIDAPAGIGQISNDQTPGISHRIDGTRVRGTAAGLTVRNGRIMFNKQ